MVNACDHIQQRGLTTPRFAHNGDELAAIDGQVNAFEHGELTRGILKCFDDTVHIDHGVSGGHGMLVRNRLTLRASEGFLLRLARVHFFTSRTEGKASSSPSVIWSVREKRDPSERSCVTITMVLP